MHNRIAYCFDLDSTITTTEILPQLARPLGVADDMKTLTELTMKGLIPFAQSFSLRIKLLCLLSLEESVNIVYNTPLCDDIVAFIKDHKDNCFVITGNLDCYITGLIQDRIGCRFFCSKGDIREDGKLYGVKQIVDKAEVVAKFKEEYDYVVTIGDGSNDIEMTKLADIGIAYSGIRKSPQELVDIAHIVSYSPAELIGALRRIHNIYSTTGKLPLVGKYAKKAA